MIEILGGSLDTAILELDINAVKTYDSKYEMFGGDVYQVWELSSEELAKLDSTPNEIWKDKYGWYGYYDTDERLGCTTDESIIVNNKSMINPLSGTHLNVSSRKYDNLNILIEEIDMSISKNICSLLIEFAQANNMKLSEFFKSYQG